MALERSFRCDFLSFLAIAAKQIELFEIWELTKCQESNDLQVWDLGFSQIPSTKRMLT